MKINDISKKSPKLMNRLKINGISKKSPLKVLDKEKSFPAN